jgi:O-antigen/teichoic acid export membrane protein
MKIQDIATESVSALRTLVGSRSAILVRIRRGIAANIFGQVVSIAIQLAMLPVLLANWGVAVFGVWTLISVVPAYLGMADLGFTTAATSKMAMAIGRGDEAGARRTFQGVLVLNLALTVVGILTAAALLYVWSADALTFGHVVDGVTIKYALLFFVIATFFSLGWNAVAGTLKADGQYALATVYSDSIRLMDCLASLIVAGLFHGDIAQVAASMMIVRVLAALIGMVMVRRRVSWVRYGLKGVDLGELKSLARPALAVLAIPIGYSLSLQGMILVVGALIDVRAVALYSATRTVGRLSSQAVALANHASMPELARAAGANDWVRAGRLIWLNILAAAIVAVLFLAGVNLIGPQLIHLWSGGHLEPGRMLLLLISAACAIQAMSNASGNMLIALNSHDRYAYVFLAMAILAVGAAFVVAPPFGLTGVAVSGVVIELVMLTVAIVEVRRRIRQHMTGVI